MIMKCADCGMETDSRVTYSNHTRYGCVVVKGNWHERHKEYTREYNKRYREGHKGAIATWQRKYQPIYRKKNPEKIIELRRRTRDNLRTDVLTAYGNKCACCGEETRQFLSIDHMDGNGRKHRRENGLMSGQAFYAWLRRNKYPPRFQVLCHNCNCAKGYYGECPHKKSGTLAA